MIPERPMRYAGLTIRVYGAQREKTYRAKDSARFPRYAPACGRRGGAWYWRSAEEKRGVKCLRLGEIRPLGAAGLQKAPRHLNGRDRNRLEW